jgi:hypothetical protein
VREVGVVGAVTFAPFYLSLALDAQLHISKNQMLSACIARRIGWKITLFLATETMPPNRPISDARAKPSLREKLCLLHQQCNTWLAFKDPSIPKHGPSIQNPSGFKSERDFAAWRGLTLRQNSERRKTNARANYQEGRWIDQEIARHGQPHC